MKIVIAGAGEVGSHLAKLLSREEQDIMLLDDNRERLANIDANYNLMTLRGNPISFKSLKEAGVDRCDLFIAVTPDETSNVVACAMAKSIGAKKTVARIDNYEFQDFNNRPFFTNLGVNAVIYPEYLAAQEIITALRRSWVRHWFELHDGQLIIVGVKIRDTAKIIDMQLKEFAMTEHNFHVAAIKRKHETARRRPDIAERHPLFRHHPQPRRRSARHMRQDTPPHTACDGDGRKQNRHPAGGTRRQ